MELTEVKKNLNKVVFVKNQHLDDTYILTGCIIRKDKNGEFYYSVELKDLRLNSIAIARLEDIYTVD